MSHFRLKQQGYRFWEWRKIFSFGSGWRQILATSVSVWYQDQNVCIYANILVVIWNGRSVGQIFRTIFKRGIIWQDDSFCAAFIFSDVVVSPGLCVPGSISLGKEMLPGEKLPGLGFGDASEIIQLWALCSLSPTPEIWLVPLHRGAKAPPSELLLQLSPLSFSWVSLEERGCDCKIWRQAAKKSIWWRDTTNQVLFPLSPEKVSENQ